jgi:hypothetical protein
LAPAHAQFLEAVRRTGAGVDLGVNEAWAHRVDPYPFAADFARET